MFGRRIKHKGLLGVSMTESSVSLAWVVPYSGGYRLKQLYQVEMQSPLTHPREVRQLVESKGLSGYQVMVVLQPRQYHLILLERPDVPDEELVEALRWRVRDMISYPPEKALIDYIDLPDDAFRGRNRMIYAVVAEESLVKKYESWCEHVGLRLVGVDIPEFCAANLVAPLAEGEAGSALLVMGEEGSSINLMSDKSLYFSRAISLGLNQEELSISSAILEIQRSLDYYESQIGKPACIQLMVYPYMEDDSPLVQGLRVNLPLDILTPSLADLVEVDASLKAENLESMFLTIAVACRPVDSLEMP